VASPAANADGVACMAVAGRTRSTNDDTMEVVGRTLRTDEDDGPKEGEDEEPGAAVVDLTQMNTDEDAEPEAEEAAEVMSCVLPPTIVVDLTMADEDEDEDEEPVTVVSGYVPPPAIMVDLTMVDTDEDND
jgi:hypothetical protein